ncbi:hypothetical protein FGU71_02880 [Erythrobacter insulae]|uniref:Uncharacterized protein n=1 Tax=Erythrobacter insulae TaxID=2584124 RepID=A0A547P9V9_9SPHN|nr:hypothetical protein FGU71_02880 [Erythrobacter insulae]
MRNNAMEPEILAAAPRCLAKTRKATACQSPAVKGRKRCRMHGGTNPGAPKGNQNARKHGGYSAQTKEAMRYVKAIARLVRDAP